MRSRERGIADFSACGKGAYATATLTERTRIAGKRENRNRERRSKGAAFPYGKSPLENCGKTM